MSFQGREFTQDMKQLVINLKQFNDIERRKKNFKAIWTIEQTAKGLGIGEATVRRIMAEYNKNRQSVPEDAIKTRASLNIQSLSISNLWCVNTYALKTLKENMYRLILFVSTY